MNVIIVGGWKLSYFLCRTFSSKGYRVSIINNDKEKCRKLARKTKATIIHGDGSMPHIFEEAEPALADIVVAVTPNDQDNLVICQLAILYGIARTLAYVNDPDNEPIFKKLGITDTFSNTRVLSGIIEQKTMFEDIISLVPVGDDRINFTEITLGSNSPLAGNMLKNIHMPENSLIAFVKRDDKMIVPRGSSLLNTGDKIVVITLPENHGPVVKYITGEKG